MRHAHLEPWIILDLICHVLRNTNLMPRLQWKTHQKIVVGHIRLFLAVLPFQIRIKALGNPRQRYFYSFFLASQASDITLAERSGRLVTMKCQSPLGTCFFFTLILSQPDAAIFQRLPLQQNRYSIAPVEISADKIRYSWWLRGFPDRRAHL